MERRSARRLTNEEFDGIVEAAAKRTIKYYSDELDRTIGRVVRRATGWLVGALMAAVGAWFGLPQIHW